MTIEERSRIILDSILALLPAPPAEFDYDYALAAVAAQVEAQMEDEISRHIVLTKDKMLRFLRNLKVPPMPNDGLLEVLRHITKSRCDKGQ